jgi:hypothetical protein
MAFAVVVYTHRYLIVIFFRPTIIETFVATICHTLISYLLIIVRRQLLLL